MAFQLQPASPEEIAQRLAGSKPAVKAVVEASPATVSRQRARGKKGVFVADDPSTPDTNEAWVEKPAKE
jgi:hypothetical protein